MEKTLVLIKPDGVQRQLVGEIIRRFESRGLMLLAAKFIQVDRSLAEKHYEVHRGKPYFEGLVKYITSSPLMAMVWYGPQAIAAVRQTIGDKDPLIADPGTIRHDLAILTSRNLTHASDSIENAATEISIWFKPEEIFLWERAHENWFTGKN